MNKKESLSHARDLKSVKVADFTSECWVKIQGSNLIQTIQINCLVPIICEHSTGNIIG